LGGKEIVLLTGETAADLKLIHGGDIIFATPQQWDSMSRKWKQRTIVQSIELFIMDDIHLLGSEGGEVMEVIISRMRYMNAQTETKTRIIALGASLANARDIAEWIGSSSQACFNFHPSVRPVPLEIHIQGYNIPHFPSLMMAMSRPTFKAIENLSRAESTIIFVPSRKQTRMTASDMLTFCAAEDKPKKFLHCSEADIQPFVNRFHDNVLGNCVESGVAYYHEGLSRNDEKLVSTLFSKGAIQVLVASRESVWGMNLKAGLVIIMGSQYFEGKEHRYVDYPIPDILQMLGKASKSVGDTACCVLMCNSNKKDYYKKYLHEAMPLESVLNTHLHDHFNAEIVAKTIENKQDAVDYLTWTFLYRRLAQNPMFYVYFF
jgi:pre-mRNA-splicing helicase BRR2